MDLGIARGIEGESITRASSILGTAGYVSPEQARGEPVDHRSDIYSLGCVLYEMLTGRQPFEGDNPVAVAYQHVHDAPVPPSSLEPSVPPALESVVLRAMEKDPAGEVPERGRHGECPRRRDRSDPRLGPAVDPAVGRRSAPPTDAAGPDDAGTGRRRDEPPPRAHETDRPTPAAPPDGSLADRRGRARPPRRPRVRVVRGRPLAGPRHHRPVAERLGISVALSLSSVALADSDANPRQIPSRTRWRRCRAS